LPAAPPRTWLIVAAGITIGPDDGVAASVSAGLSPVALKISKYLAPG
jgi:hypothetical protein